MALLIWSAAASGQELVDALGIEPDTYWDRGDIGAGGRPHKRAGARFNSRLPEETVANEQISALLARVAGTARQIGRLAATPETEVILSIGYFVNDPQWQIHGENTLVRGLGVSLNPAHIELLHTMHADFDIDFYVNIDNSDERFTT